MLIIQRPILPTESMACHALAHLLHENAHLLRKVEVVFVELLMLEVVEPILKDRLIDRKTSFKEITHPVFRIVKVR